MPGSNGDAVDEYLTEICDDAGAEVLAAGGRAGVDDDDVGGFEGGLGGGANGVEVVGDDVAALRRGAPGFGQGAEHEAVEFDQFAGPRVPADGNEFAAGGNHGHAGRRDNLYLGVPGGGQGAEVAGFQAAALGEHQFGGHDVLAHWPDVLPGRGGGDDLDRAVTTIVDVFDHDHGVGVGRHGVAGVDPDGFRVQLESPRGGLGCAYGAVRRHRHAVHGGGGKVRAGEGGPDGCGGDVAEGLVQGQAEGLAGRPIGELGQGPRHSFASRGQGHVVEVDGALVGARRFRHQPRRLPPVRRRPAESV